MYAYSSSCTHTNMTSMKLRKEVLLIFLNLIFKILNTHTHTHTHTHKMKSATHYQHLISVVKSR